MTADFFLLPTRQELFGFVFGEASAFGLPAITTNTGGVSGAIRDGENGYMLPISAGGADYAELIARIYQDEQHYAELVRSSRAAFDTRLNWDAWADGINTIIVEMIEREKDIQIGKLVSKHE
jgi:glycosyltransferase involved in cell wall biosynthesis